MKEKIKRNPKVNWRLENIKEKKLYFDKEIEKIKSKWKMKDWEQAVMFMTFNNELYQLTSLAASLWIHVGDKKIEEVELIKTVSHNLRIANSKIIEELEKTLAEMKKLGLFCTVNKK